ncbi:hypothetical protein [Mannheimia haemolytica]|uniref:hypothetical protein n=1 Tax=Mannheimia haemolytica TaxID=75985 RepID=UPI00201C406F|nr:hypothetical protein [Mannheimia haemolytica]UQX70468.1 hypothetical protein M3705_03075 [Mannheimia haemolytica]
MRKLGLLAVFTLVLSACSNSTKIEQTILSKQDIVGSWVCAIKYDDLKVSTLDFSEFKANGEMTNFGDISDENFEPIKFTYVTGDKGKWELKGNRLVIDYDLSERKVKRTTPKKFLEFLKQEERKASKTAKKLLKYEQGIFNILSDQKNTENSKIILDILKFGHSRMAIQQNMGDKVYSGGCVTADKAEEYLDILKNRNSK